jgi:hypothetical protein
VRIRPEGACAFGGAEEVLDVPDRLPRGGMGRVDCHVADGVDGQPGPIVLQGERVHAYGLGDVLELSRPELADRERRVEGLTSGVGQQHLAGAGEIGDAGGEVDGATEPVLTAPDGGARVDANTDAERSVPGAVAGHDARREPDRLVGVVDSQEHGVADRLDLFGAVLLEQRSDGCAELGGRVGGVLVAVRLGQSGVAGEVREQE